MISSVFSTAARGAVTDYDADALLGPYNKSDPYPALTSKNLLRREMRDQGAYNGFQENCFESSASHSSTGINLMESVLSTMFEDDLSRILSKLDLSEKDKQIARLFVEGATLAECAHAVGAHRSWVHRRKAVIAHALQLFWLDDAYYGLRECLHGDTYRNVYQACSRTDAPAPDPAACDCAQQSHRVQNGTPVSYHCEACGRKRSRAEFDDLTRE